LLRLIIVKHSRIIQIILLSLSTLHLTDVRHLPAWLYIQLRFVTGTQNDTDHIMHCPR